MLSLTTSFGPGPVMWTRFSIHVLVTLVFIGPKPEGKHQVNHIDANKYNNKDTNLEYVTFKEQARHAREAGVIPDRRHIGKAIS